MAAVMKTSGLAGLLTGAVALGVAELTAAITGPNGAPVVAVGETAINLTPVLSTLAKVLVDRPNHRHRADAPDPLITTASEARRNRGPFGPGFFDRTDLGLW